MNKKRLDEPFKYGDKLELSNAYRNSRKNSIKTIDSNGELIVNIVAIKNCAPPEKINKETNPVSKVLNPAACSKIPQASPIGM